MATVFSGARGAGPNILGAVDNFIGPGPGAPPAESRWTRAPVNAIVRRELMR